VTEGNERTFLAYLNINVPTGWTMFSSVKRGRMRPNSTQTLQTIQKGSIMTTRYAFLSAVLTIALTLPLLGQGTGNDTTKTNLNQPEMSNTLGNPVVDIAVGGIQMKVWLLTKEQHREIMSKEMGHMPMRSEREGEMGKMEVRTLSSTSMATVKEMKGLRQEGPGIRATTTSTDKDTVETIQGNRSMNNLTTTSGTHNIVLDATEIASGKEIADPIARVLIEYPSKKTSTVNLKPMMKHSGSALTLDEKGEYRFTVHYSFAGGTRTTQFQYAVK
jgi:hypothetical protein